MVPFMSINRQNIINLMLTMHYRNIFGLFLLLNLVLATNTAGKQLNNLYQCTPTGQGEA